MIIELFTLDSQGLVGLEKIKESNSAYHVEIAVRIPPNAEPATEKASETEILVPQRVEKALAVKPTSIYLSEPVASSLVHKEQDSVIECMIGLLRM